MVKHLLKCLIFVSTFFLINQAAQAIEIGGIPPKVELREKLGGRLDGKPWAARSYRGRSMSFFTSIRMNKIRTMMPAKLCSERSFPAISFNRLGS